MAMTSERAVELLQKLGYEPSAAGLSSFQKDQGLPASGKLDETTAERLEKVADESVPWWVIVPAIVGSALSLGGLYVLLTHKKPKRRDETGEALSLARRQALIEPSEPFAASSGPMTEVPEAAPPTVMEPPPYEVVEEAEEEREPPRYRGKRATFEELVEIEKVAKTRAAEDLGGDTSSPRYRSLIDAHRRSLFRERGMR